MLAADPVVPIQNLVQRRQPATASTKPSKEPDRAKATNWGRSWNISFFTTFGLFSLLVMCPVLVAGFLIACTDFKCSIWGTIVYARANGLANLFYNYFPKPTLLGFKLYYGWLAFQAIMYMNVPAKTGYGQMTPAGYKLPYVVNGLRVWMITHVLYLGASLGLCLFKASIIADNWGALFIAANSYGYFLTVFSYIKAYLFPSHPADRKFSNSYLYDMFMGIEFNPRIGSFDFKLFHNGRPGIVAWTLINISFAAAQYNEIGYITNSMMLLNGIHALYVLDFFYNEDWYLRTIDIAHDHFGFYLAWGDTVWLPYMYTLQSHFLLRHPLDLSAPYFMLVFSMASLGYYIFRSVNNQKDLVRTTDGDCKIWGKQATFIRTTFNTTDGKKHSSLLLTSGWWGLSRHANYIGDLILSLSMCMTCGVEYLLPYFYIVYMTILLVMRVERDHERCSAKYGIFWEQVQ